jgi:hypothetical protein
MGSELAEGLRHQKEERGKLKACLVTEELQRNN